MLTQQLSKIAFLKDHKFQDLIKRTMQEIATRLNSASVDFRMAPAIVRGIQIDLCYALFRHRTWIHAPVLAELCVDFLNTEYYLPNPVASQVVEGTAEVLGRYFPAADRWQTDDYDREFLTDLLMSAATSKSDDQLRADIGLGENVIGLLLAAFTETSDQLTLRFEPAISATIDQIVADVIQRLKDNPWTLDAYRVKKRVEASSWLGSNSKSFQFYTECFEVLVAVGWQGNSRDQVVNSLSFSAATHLDCLLASNLIYAQTEKKSERIVLSQSGIFSLRDRFLTEFTKSGGGLMQLGDYPAILQTMILEAGEVSFAIAELNEQILLRLDPKALFQLLSKPYNEADRRTLLEILTKIQHNKWHRWAKSEVSRALAKYPKWPEVGNLLQSLTSKDNPIKSRKVAEAALKTWQQQGS